MIAGGRFPVDQVHGLCDLACLGLHRHAIAQQLVHGLVVAVQAAVGVIGLGAQLVQRRADLCRAVASARQILGQQALFDVTVASAVGPVAQVAVPQFVTKQLDHAVLRDALRFANIAHMDVFSLSARSTR